MKVIVSAAVSLDGYLDDCSAQRLRLSSPEDWDAVHRLRAECDAILVGAGTLRADNPSLVIDNPQLRALREARGMSPDIMKVTLTRTGNIDTEARFFSRGGGDKIVFTTNAISQQNRCRISSVAQVVELSDETATAHAIVGELARRGIKQLIVEGGSKVLTMFFEQDAVDEFRLAVAPIFVGESGAPQLVGAGCFPFDKEHRMKLTSVEKLGDTAVMHYKRNLHKDGEK